MSSAEARRAELKALLLATARGDRNSFQDLYHAAAPRLFGLSLRMLRDRESARDALQETMLRIWEKSRLFDPGKGEAMAWMATVARRCILNRVEGRPAATAEDFDERALAVPDSGGSNPELAVDIRRCLDRLTEKYRNCVIMIYRDGLSYEELAARLEVPVGTVRTWIHRAIGQLEQCLER